MTPIQIDEFRKKVEKETFEKIVDKIEVNDSYFYASMMIYELPLSMENPFSQNKFGVVIRLNLFNSKDFEHPNQISDKPIKHLKGKEIKVKLEIDKEKLASKEDAMMIIYDEVGKEIAKDLFQANAANIYQMTTGNKTRRTYI
jgi:hypothetical protein